MKNTATIAERTSSVIIVRDVTTSLPTFSTGQAAFNWARKNNANNCTVLVKGRRGRASAMVIVKVDDHYEGR